MPVSEPSRIILHCRLHARLDDLDGVRPVDDPAQQTRRESTPGEFRVVDDTAQVVEIGLNAIESCPLKFFAKALNGVVTRIRAYDDFRKHGIVERRDLRSILDPRLATRAARQADLGENARAWAKAMCCIFRIDANLNRSAVRFWPESFEGRQLACSKPN